MKKTRYILAVIFLLAAAVGLYFLYRYNIIPKIKYNDSHFDIETYVSEADTDGDGIDDQTDILDSALAYLDTKPEYKSKYYATGYPDDNYGVCTDVVAFALKGAGYDLMKLVNDDIIANPDKYSIDKPDINIDFRRVRNLSVYFKNHATSLTTDTSQIAEWQAGDIVVWEKHIGIISNHRSRDGVPFVLHNANPYQLRYEEDVLETTGEIIGHYRIG